MPDSPAAPPTLHFAWKSIPWLAILAGIMLLQIWFPRVDAPQLNDTYNVDVGGRNAFFQFTERRAENVSRSLRSLPRLATDLPSDATICILGPARVPTELEWSLLLNWVNRGGRLLYASRWEEPAVTIPFLNVKVVATADSIPGSFHQFQKANAKNPSPTGGDNPPGVTPPGAGSPKSQVAPIAPPVVPAGPEIVPPAPVVADLGNPKFPLMGVDWQSIGKVESLRGELLLGTGFSNQVVRLPYGNGSIIVAASDHLFSNKSLYDKSHRNGVLAAQLLEAAGVRRDSTVVFDESLNMTGTPRVVGLLLDPLLRPITIQSALLLVLFAWAGSVRFGTVLPPALPQRHDVTDHTNALGNLYWRSGNGIAPLKAYCEQLLAELKLGVRRGKATRSVESVAARAGMPVEEVRKLLALASEACERSSVLCHDAATVIRKLARLRDRGEERSGKTAK